MRIQSVPKPGDTRAQLTGVGKGMTAQTLDMDRLMETFAEKLVWWALYGLLLCFIFGVMLVGVVLFIVFAAKKKFVFRPGTTDIPRQLKFSLAVGNSGMLTFALYWVIVIVRQLHL